MSLSRQTINAPSPTLPATATATATAITSNLHSKRKLDEFSLLSSDSENLAMGRHPLFNPNPNPNPRVSSMSSLPSASGSTIQFFVRADRKTHVLHFPRSATVASVISQVRPAAGADSPDHFRLIYLGRQLDPESTLDASRVTHDSTLHLAARLRSTRLPRSWQIADDLLLSASHLYHGRAVPREIKRVEPLLLEFLASTPTPARGGSDENTVEHLHIFVLSAVPATLVKLYISDRPECRAIAERAVRLFLKYAPDYVPKPVHLQCSMVVLEFCKLIAATAGRGGQLYLDCRKTLASLIESVGLSGFVNMKSLNLVLELYPFVNELSDILIDQMKSETVYVHPSILAEFASFLVAIRKATKEWFRRVGGSGKVSRSLLSDDRHPRHEKWVVPLYRVFVNLLMKVDECLGKFEGSPVGKSPETILDVITSVRKFSKIYEESAECFHAFLRTRRACVNGLIHRARRNEKLRWLLKYKDVTDFESRQSLTLMLFPEGKGDYEWLHEMLIDRSQLLAESFEYIGQVEAQVLHGGLFMEFKNEEATGPGVLREWFTLVCRAIFNPQNVLFLPCPNDRRRFFPNPASVVDPLHLKYFGFCGRVIALALMHKVQVGIVFDRVFFLQLAGKTITLEDVKDADPCLYMSCKKILEIDAELLDSDILGLTFVREIEELGTQPAVELCPGGKDIIVNSNNREEYINLLIKHRFVISTSEQVSHFARGFSDILSNSKLQKFFFLSLDLNDFDRMLGGSDGINVSDWRSHTEYNGYKVKDRLIGWFWKIVEGMSEEQRRVLLFFWTSVKYLPVDGFGGLPTKLYIYKSNSRDHLPTSHTCFYRLCLPQYPSMSIMRDRLQLITQEHVSCSFGMW